MYKYSYDSSSESSDNENQSGNSIGTLDLTSSHLTSEKIALYFERFEETQAKRYEILDTLILAHNFLQTVTIDVSRFVNLRTLDLSNNQISFLPDAITRLPLTCLIVKNNYLTNSGLPKCFQEFTSLKVCHMSGNQLFKFPAQLLEVKNIEYLYVGNNRITELPRDIDALKK